MTFAKLTGAQILALDAAAKAPLLKARACWGHNMNGTIRTATVERLAARGLLDLDPLGGCSGRAVITAAGRGALAEAREKGWD